MYNWRIAVCKPGSPERQRMLKEADFAFRQAFALCPYSPEALFRYVNLLLTPEVNRFEDALLLVKTSQKLDPFNTNIQDLLSRLQDWKGQRTARDPSKMERQLRQNPGDFQTALNLANEYFQLGQTGPALQALNQILNASNIPSGLLRSLIPVYTTLSNESKLHKTVDLLAAEFQNDPSDLEAGIAVAEGYRSLHQTQAAIEVLGKVLNSPSVDAEAVLQVAQQLAALGSYPLLEKSLEKLTTLAPADPEAWYDLAAMRSIFGKSPEALQALRQALKLSTARRARDPKARDLLAELQHDPRFSALRSLPEFQSLAAGK
jgi:Flp pilus assembly protein TadD